MVWMLEGTSAVRVPDLQGNHEVVVVEEQDLVEVPPPPEFDLSDPDVKSATDGEDEADYSGEVVAENDPDAHPVHDGSRWYGQRSGDWPMASHAATCGYASATQTPSNGEQQSKAEIPHT